MKTLYLHIGTPKTATSSIQVFLGENTELLASQGCAFPIFSQKYPHVRKERNGHFLFLDRPSLVSKKPPEPSKEWNETLTKCLSIIEKAFKSSDTVLLTDENLWWSVFYAPMNFLDILPEFAKKQGCVFKVIVYLRRQDAFMESLYKSKIKGAKTALDMRSWYEDHEKNFPQYFDYEATLKKIADGIGQENVIVRRFEPDSWKMQSICMDFLDAVGLDLSLPYQNAEEVVNPGLKGNMVELQRIVNEMDSLDLKEKYQFADFTKQLSDKREDEVPYYVFTPEETAAFLDRFREGNANVARTYIGDGKPLFSDSRKEVPVWSLQNDQMLTDTVRFFVCVTNDLYRKNQELEKRVKKLEKKRASSLIQKVLRRLKKFFGQKKAGVG